MAVPRGSHRNDDGLRASRGAARRQRWRRQEQGGRAGIFEERALEGTFEERALEDREPLSGLDMGIRDEGGLDGTSGNDGERRGAVRSPDQSPSQSDPPPCPAVPAV